MDSSEEEPALDFSPRELDSLRILTNHDVRFMIIGGFAVRFYGHLRTTKDIDVWVSNDQENARRLCAALCEIIGYAAPNLSVREIAGRRRKIDLGVHGVDLDVLTGQYETNFEDAYPRSHRTAVSSGSSELVVPIIAKADLIATKLEAHRPLDLEDVAALRR
jgi:hypothetical protein